MEADNYDFLLKMDRIKNSCAFRPFHYISRQSEEDQFSDMVTFRIL